MTTAIRRDLTKARFWRHFSVQTLAAVGLFAVLIGLFDVIFPNVVPKGGRWVAIVVVVLSLIYGAVRAWPRPIEQSYDSPNTTIRLVEGDLFAEPGHLVIGMSDTFDTEVPHVIASNSVQAQFARRIFHEDMRELDRQLAEALIDASPLCSISKPGKQVKYPVGTVATLRDHARRYFCVAYTEMNEHCEARGTTDGIWRSLENLWKAVCAHGNGGVVSIPVIGGGQSRLSQVLPAQDAIRFTILSFVLASRREKICDELRIVVRPSDYDKLDRLEIQAFLKSLRAS
ncbi:hypothetical protein GB931_14040 [Modestobacter sp. I12A-02628]|uniref:Thoeris protein ThsA Macro domain-containing protein n=1 Tax=Goekera deserti TaxID=2497753 RepID=A0A7K3WHK3_9ACTN|nr:macro domain-containing protein [Goekera deserti]MPQ99023.1 hypothetical protein [Goekera deserti]NDI47357.1 hypothetical protein [Goekera deserti]NEL55887.1 hypothetical protein [Goekera deserti]